MGICIGQPKNTDQQPTNIQHNPHIIQQAPIRKNNIEENQANKVETRELIRRSMVLERGKSSDWTKKESLCGDRCDICYEKYSILKRWPLEICSNAHYICEQCVLDFHKVYLKEPFPCPFCRLLAFQHQIKPFHKLFRSLSQQYRTINQKERSGESNQLNPEQIQFFSFLCEHELYEIAKIMRQNRPSDLGEVQHLNFGSKQLESFTYFNRFKKVQYLQLENNVIQNCEFMHPIGHSVRILNISSNNISSLEFIRQFKNIQILGCENNLINSVPFCLSMLLLKQCFLIGNPLNSTNLEGFKIRLFKKLEILSISSVNNIIQTLLSERICQKIKNQLMPMLRRVIFPYNFCSKKEKCIVNNIQIIPRISEYSFQRNDFSEIKYLRKHFDNMFQYGDLFQFDIDEKNPHNMQYCFRGGVLAKKSSNFTVMNSKEVLIGEGRKSLRLKINKSKQCIMVGICTSDIKYNASVYSNDFIGISLWGTIYNRGEKTQIEQKLRLNEDSIISMTVDFQKSLVIWKINERTIGLQKSTSSFLNENQLHFAVGMRDEDLQMKFIQ